IIFFMVIGVWNCGTRPLKGRDLQNEIMALGFYFCVRILGYFKILERVTRLELSSPTLAMSCSTN
ncbi:hypothetical protein ACVGWT_04820, partial [Enterobacter hormaechei]